MRILFVGDLVGQPGREVFRRLVPGLKRELRVDFVVANCENAAGGFGITHAQAEDWGREYKREYPNAADWVTRPIPDHSSIIATIDAPTLLVWGDADPISPVSVGERLLELLPDATLRVLAGGTHWLAVERAGEVAELIAQHLG